jgi:O-antigen/teichoic acid export membrane protein
MESIRPKVVRSGFWSLGGNWFSRVLGIIKMIILARLLSPLDFGIIGLAILSINALNVFSETGIESALIQRDKIGRPELDTAWTIAIIRGLVLFVLLFLSAGWFASYFGNITLKPVLEIMSVTFLIGGCTNIGIVFFQKELEFKKKVLLDSTADIAGAVSAVSLALYIRNVWALVIGTVVWVTVKCLISYWLHPYRPKIRWDWPVAKNLLDFGKHIFWISVVTFIVTSGDDALVGKLLGLTVLGFYTMAYNIANIPVSSLAGVTGKISFPAYSLMEKEPDRLRAAFVQVFEAVVIILLPLTGLIMLLAQDFTLVCLGEKWLPMVPALRVLCLLGLFRSISNLFAPVQLAMNKPNIQSRNKTIELLAFIVLVYPFTAKWGLIGASWSVTLVYAISALINTIDTSRLLSPLGMNLIKSLIFPFLLLAILSFNISISMTFMSAEIVYLRFLFIIALSLFIYGSALIIFKRQFLLSVFPLLSGENNY